MKSQLFGRAVGCCLVLLSILWTLSAQAASWTALEPMLTGRWQHTLTPLANGKVLVAGGYNASGQTLATAELFDFATGRWTPTGSMTTVRAQHSATLLPDGRVLVAGGRVNAQSGTPPLASAEIYDPATGQWSPAASLPQGRFGHTAVRMASDRVLVCGGTSTGAYLASCSIYDPVQAAWQVTGSMGQAHFGHTMTVLHDGRVLAAGGRGMSAFWMSAVEIFDPATGIWQPAANMNVPRYRHSATLLPNGKVLVAGGEVAANQTGTDTAELFDPLAGTWTPTGNLTSTRMSHSASLLPDGRVAVVGGENGNQLTDVYDPAQGIWTPSASVLTVRWLHTAVLLPGGRIMVAGGLSASGTLASAEVFDLTAGQWNTSGNLLAGRSDHAATLLGGGDVLIVGGYGSGFAQLSSAERYNPAIGTWSPAGAMATARVEHRTTLLADGRVLVSGGYNLNGGNIILYTNAAEIYDPGTGAWSLSGALNQGRSRHTATLLADGRVLAVGGNPWGPDAEIFDPASGAWTATSPMQVPSRREHSATLLPNGKVLVVGGHNGNYPNYNYLSSAELFDPATGLWSLTESLTGPRAYHSATLLANGKVLVAGGEFKPGSPRSELATSVLYDPATGTWNSEGALNQGRLAHRAVLLGSGRVLVVGGATSGGGTKSAEIYDPATHLWVLAGNMSDWNYDFSLTPLAGGKLLLAGGRYIGDPKATTEMFEETPGVADVRRPEIAGANNPHYPGTMLTLTGSGFIGDSGASSGSWHDTPTNFPLVRLLRLDNGATTWLKPARRWHAGYFGAITPNDLALGPYLSTVYVNGIQSASKMINVRTHPAQRFADVPASHWAAAYINGIADMGITTGCGSGNYCPANNVTREQMAAFIIRAVEGEPAACTSAPFVDVPTGSGFCKYIQRMKDLNITTGCGSGSYCPTQNVTREQMAAFIIRAVEGEPTACSSAPFVDVPTGNLFCKYITRMKALNITTGCGGGSYCPTGLVNREQMAAFLARAFLGM